MSSLYLDRQSTRIDLREGVLIIENESGEQTRWPQRLIERLIVHGQTLISASTITRLAEAGTHLLFLGGRSAERHAQLTGSLHNDARIRLAQMRIFADPELAYRYAHHWVSHKLQAQVQLLEEQSKARPDRRKDFFDGLQTLTRIRIELQAMRASGTIARLRGLEGAAAAAYFPAYFSALPPSVAKGQRSRRPPKDPANACLSLGYTLLYARTSQACIQAGLDPAIGTLHGLAHGRAALACDLMEPHRAAIDHLVWQLFRSEELRTHHFASDGGPGYLLGKAGRSLFYRAIEDCFQQGLARQLERQARALAKLLLRQAQRLDTPEHWQAIWDSETITA